MGGFQAGLAFLAWGARPRALLGVPGGRGRGLEGGRGGPRGHADASRARWRSPTQGACTARPHRLLESRLRLTRSSPDSGVEPRMIITSPLEHVTKAGVLVQISIGYPVPPYGDSASRRIFPYMIRGAGDRAATTFEQQPSNP